MFGVGPCTKSNFQATVSDNLFFNDISDEVILI